MNTKYNFSSFFSKANIFSLVLFILSILLISFKGLNYGIDFKGGTLIELRVFDKNIGITEIRSSFKDLINGDVNVKEFGNKGDFLIKIEQNDTQTKDFIPNLKKKY